MLKTIAGLQGVTILGRDAQKKINGGNWTCSCSGHAGTWEYLDSPSVGEMVDDINTYCRNGGSCSNG